MVQDHWFLIRGLVRESAHWGRFRDDFAAAFPGARVQGLDLAGNGRHHRSDTPLTVPAMMELLRAEALALSADGGRRFVFAVSLGGMVALAWAHAHPSELAGIVLGNTSLGGFSPFHHRLRPAAWGTILRSAATRDLLSRERALLRLTSNRTEVHDATAEEWIEIGRQRPVQPKNALRQVVAAARYRPPLHPPSVPHLILCGLGDQLVDPSCSREIERRWGGPFAAHPTAGHDLTLDAGPWVIEQIRSWQDALPGPLGKAQGGLR